MFSKKVNSTKTKKGITSTFYIGHLMRYTYARYFLPIIAAVIGLCTACVRNQPNSEPLNIPAEDTLAWASADTACNDMDTIAMPVKTEDMLAKKPVKLSEIKNEKVITAKIIETVAPEKADQALKPAAGGMKGDSLQTKFNLLTNDKLGNMEKMTVIKDIQNQFVDKSSDRVTGKFVGEAKSKYSIIEYLRRIKMTNSRKVHIKDIKTNGSGRIEHIMVEEVDESSIR